MWRRAYFANKYYQINVNERYSWNFNLLDQRLKIHKTQKQTLRPWQTFVWQTYPKWTLLFLRVLPRFPVRYSQCHRDIADTRNNPLRGSWGHSDHGSSRTYIPKWVKDKETLWIVCKLLRYHKKYLPKWEVITAQILKFY